jgi:hypothetical protein
VHEGPISDRALAALRGTAALIHSVGHIRALVMHHDRVIVEVRADAVEGRPHQVLTPCGFRASVARAVRLRRTGERVAMRGLPGTCEPSIRLGLPDGDLALPGALLRLQRGELWWHVAALAVPADTAFAALADAEVEGVGVGGDDALAACILRLVTPVGDVPASMHAVDVLRDAMAAVGAEDLVRRLDAQVPELA